MSLKQEFELLRRVPFFAEIEPAKLKLLAFMSERVGFDPGKQLFRQGDPADAAYLIIDAQAEVVVDTPGGPVVLATLGANEIVGEIAIPCNLPRPWRQPGSQSRRPRIGARPGERQNL